MTMERIDALLPPDMARRAEYIGVSKAEAPAFSTFTLAILAGAFIALGAIFATTVTAGTSAEWPFGVSKLLTGLVFCLGLILVIVGGAELFTGNNLIVMAWAGGKVSTAKLLRNWGIVYVGNFVGSVGTAVLILFSKQYTFGGGGVGKTALSIANGKVGLGFLQAMALGVLCNALVCLAVWLTFSARSTMDKIAAIIFPITAFVAAGFEHSVANMYFVPVGLLIKTFDPTFTSGTGLDLSNLTWGTFLVNNLLPVTIGNIIGGTVFVAAVYWSVFLRNKS
ncbi:MAG: formate transporter FocA [Anaerolineales bacterium]|nr:formate transporter FocA [Anaerolineales bacterium]MCB8990435.1 formate/nitrite transporter family protein [Ardenticatenaceae bacterium]MCB9003449.1 formate/nitrite transporter family protein [Ardenticatenaceae bacterium]